MRVTNLAYGIVLSDDIEEAQEWELYLMSSPGQNGKTPLLVTLVGCDGTLKSHRAYVQTEHVVIAAEILVSTLVEDWCSPLRRFDVCRLVRETMKERYNL